MSHGKDISIGASFSTKYCHTLNLVWEDVLAKSLKDLDFKQYRLMSYWDEIEKQPGQYDFSDLDKQFEVIAKASKKITLSIGIRQPRWPESHPPEWALKVREESPQQYHEHALDFLIKVVDRYKDNPALISYQLENEALNKGIGINADFSRDRLINEYNNVKNQDPKNPIIMSTSNNFGIPVRGPIPDIVAFSMYLNQYENGALRSNKVPLFWFRARKALIEKVIRRPVIIHELQAEPWGPVSTQDMTCSEQDECMDVAKIKKNFDRAVSLNVKQIDFWGLEWWYWRKKFHNDSFLIEEVKNFVKNTV